MFSGGIEKQYRAVMVKQMLPWTFLMFDLNKGSAKLRTLHALPIINTRLRACAPLLTNKHFTHLFLSRVVVSIVRYALRLKNPRKVASPDFITLKVIKFASNVIDSHL